VEPSEDEIMQEEDNVKRCCGCGEKSSPDGKTLLCGTTRECCCFRENSMCVNCYAHDLGRCKMLKVKRPGRGARGTTQGRGSKKKPAKLAMGRSASGGSQVRLVLCFFVLIVIL
jgi:hypothetical protein